MKIMTVKGIYHTFDSIELYDNGWNNCLFSLEVLRRPASGTKDRGEHRWHLL
jgi:hypothetical protein